MDPTSLFSALEVAPRSATAALASPTTNPFQAPDFGEDEALLLEDAPGPASGRGAAQPKAAGSHQ
ncbi:hypothetical protein B1H19_02385 [Streptomyces gilvosporeus]|uniref:Uncharacterized protein n=1 Tax=Streptomyces gilvosporeus TaxID=553510 RepID=A0A1V0U1Y5_9ACTN|nr:hypothetical protein B1H19_02385 [Streptomyces gilvosporeus]